MYSFASFHTRLSEGLFLLRAYTDLISPFNYQTRSLRPSVSDCVWTKGDSHRLRLLPACPKTSAWGQSNIPRSCYLLACESMTRLLSPPTANDSRDRNNQLYLHTGVRVKYSSLEHNAAVSRPAIIYHLFPGCHECESDPALPATCRLV